MQYPVEMYRVLSNGQVEKMRFKQDAPIDKPGWFMTATEAMAKPDLTLAKPSLATDKPSVDDIPIAGTSTDQKKTLFKRRKRKSQ